MPVTSVPQALVADLCTALGYQPNDVRSIEIEPGRITVTSFRRDADGHLVRLEDLDVATSIDVIRVEHGRPTLNSARWPEAVAYA